MSNNSNYTQIFKDHLYNCIKACKEAIDACNNMKECKDPALALRKRDLCVQACSACVDACKLMNKSASTYLTHTTETDSIAKTHSAVKQSNICIAGCHQIIESCNTASSKCPDMIEATINTIQDCIDAAQQCAMYKDL